MMKKKDLATLSLAELTALYNKHSKAQVKKFTCSKAKAIEKVLSVLPTAQRKSSRPGPHTGVCQLMTELFDAGMAPKDVYAEIRRRLPAAKTTLKGVYWYRGWLRQQGVAV